MTLRAGVLGLVAIATIAGFALAGLLNLKLWGYWIHRPDGAKSTIEESSQLAAYSSVTINQFGQMQAESGREKRARGAMAFCEPKSNECLEGSFISAARRRFGELDGVPEIEANVLKLLGPSISSLAASSFPGAPTAAMFPLRGVAFVLERDGTLEVAAAVRTSPIGNDRFGFLQANLAIDQESASVRGAEKYYFEIAGLEELDWRVTWPVLSASIFAVGLSLLLKNQRAAPPPRGIRSGHP
jgi:hypothetical protein